MRLVRPSIRRAAQPAIVLPALTAFVLAIAVVGFVRRAMADPVTQPNDRIVTNIVTNMLQKEHISQHSLDDESSRRWLKMFLKDLDPWKLYFYQSDIDEYKRFESQLDDMALSYDVKFAYEVFNRFLTRVDERMGIITDLLKDPQDFSVDEDFNLDPEKAEYPKTSEEARESWRKRLKCDLLMLKAGKDGIDGQAARDKILRRYTGYARRMHQTDSEELLEMYLTALTRSYDPHTAYMSADSYDNFSIQLTLKLFGIGASLRYDDGYTVVYEIIPGGAADKDGRLKPKDRILGVGQGLKGEIEDVQDQKLNDVVKKIRGNPGSIVRLQVMPEGKTETQTYEITRAQIELKDSEARSVILEQGKKADGSPYRVGFIELPSFYMDMEAARKGNPDFKSTTRDLQRLIDEFNQKQVDLVMIDLRKNGGGSLTEAINSTGLFIDYGPVVQVKDAKGDIQWYDDPDHGIAWRGPLVVLTSKFSASASEIFAGAIQDYQRGLVVGDHSTHGKGTVQLLLDLGDQIFKKVPNRPKLGALKITMQQFYRPDGDSTQNRGVVADVEIPSLTSHYDIGESSLEYALQFDQVPPRSHHRLGQVTPAMLKILRDNSATRRAASDDFQKLERRIARYDEQQKNKRVQLNEEKFLADRAEINAQEQEENDFEEQGSHHREVVKRDFYINEILDVAIDYLNLLSTQQTAVVGQR